MQRIFNLLVVLVLGVLGFESAFENGFLNRYMYWELSQPVSVSTLLAHPAKYKDRRVYVAGYVVDWNGTRVFASKTDAKMGNVGAFVSAYVPADEEEAFYLLQSCVDNYVQISGTLRYDRKLTRMRIMDVEDVILKDWAKPSNNVTYCYKVPED